MFLRYFVAPAVCAAALFSACHSVENGDFFSVQNKKQFADAEDTSFFVEFATPQGEFSSSALFPSVQVQFSEPVVALARLGEPSDKSPAVTIVPAVNGTFRWYGTSLLSFDCSDKLIPQKEYTIFVNPSLQSVHGTPISGQVAFSFRTEELRLLYVEPGYIARKEKNIVLNSDDLPPEYAREIAVGFSNEVNPSVISKYLVVTERDASTGAEKSHSFKASRIDEKAVLLTLAENVQRDAEIAVTLQSGAMPDIDCIATSKEQRLSFHTLRPFEPGNVSGTSTLAISFNHRLADGQEMMIADALAFSPRMSVGADDIELRGSTLLVHNLPVRYGDSYEFTLAAGTVSDIYGQTCAQKISRKINVPDADSYARWRDGNFIILESQFEPKRAFEFQNVLEKSSYTVTPIAGVTPGFPVSAAKKIAIGGGANKNQRVIQTVELAPFLEKTAGGFRGAVKFESEAFCKPHNGIFSGKEKYTTVSYIQVTDIGISVHSAWNETAVLVSSISTGNAVAGAEVSVYELDSSDDRQQNMLLLRGKKLASAMADADGLAVLRFDSASANNNLRYIAVQTADDRMVKPFDFWYDTPFRAATFADEKIVAVDGNGDAVAEVPVSSIKIGRNVTCIFSDRGLYRPGETAQFKIIDRTLNLGQYSTYSGPYEITFTNRTWGRDRVTYATLAGSTSAQGSASAEWRLPEDLAPGTYFLQYKRTDGSGFVSSQSISVQFFERLRFQANAEITPVQYLRGDTITATVTASYLGGGSLAGGTVRADWMRSATTFVPAGEKYSDFRFGPLLNSWEWRGDDKSVYDGFHADSNENLSAEGAAHVSVLTGTEPKAGAAYAYSLQAQVTDAANQMIAVRAATIVHPAAFYIGVSGMRNVRGFAQKGEKLQFSYVLAAPDGTAPESAVLPKDKKITWELQRKEWKEVPYFDEFGYQQARWEEGTVTEKTGTLSAADGTLTVTPQEGGRYLLRLTASDSKGRTVITERAFFVTSSDAYRRNDDSHELTLTADKDIYSAGDTALLLLGSTLAKGRYLLTVEREGILSEKVLALSEPTSVISVPIAESYVPVVYVGISSFAPRSGSAPADYDTRDANKPQAVFAHIALNISTESREFSVKVEADQPSYRPGSDARLTVSAQKDGKPVAGAELTLMAVDRGVLDLIGYHADNPADVFYARGLFGSGASQDDSFSYIADPVTYGTYTLPAKEREIMFAAQNRMSMKAAATAGAADMAEYGMAMDTSMAFAEEAPEYELSDDSDSGEDGAAQVRRDFRATAVFLPAVITDSEGTASVSFKLPDSLTEYVVTVVGVKEQTYGYAEVPLVAANQISARDVETRILRPGDEGEAGIVLTNLGATDEKVEVSLSVYSGVERTGYAAGKGDLARLPGAAFVAGSAERSAVIKAGGTGTAMFRIRAEEAGWITLAFRIKGRDLDEIIYRPLQIEKPYVFETVTTAGQLDADENSAEERIIFPLGAEDGRGSLHVQLDATRLGTLRSAVNYVFHYPYGCLEQRSSAILPLIAFGEYIDVFGLESEVADVNAVLAKEFASWADVQKADGGFPYWSDGRESSLAVSLRIAEILALAKDKGIAAPAKLNLDKLASFIRSELARLKKENALGRYAEAYSCYVLALLGKNVSSSDIAAIINDADSGVSEIALAGLAAFRQKDTATARQAAAKLRNLMSLTARGASFHADAPWRTWHFFNSASERYALALHLLSSLNAADSCNGHLVWEILQLQRAGQGWWQSTASTSRMLIALSVYINNSGLEKTDFTAEALLGGAEFVAGSFKGVGAQPVQSARSFAELGGIVKFGTETPLVLRKNGTGTLFYTISMDYALPVAEQNARDEGLCVYTEITDARTGEEVKPGQLKSGNIYRQKVHVTTTKERAFVAVRAPVPAGAEILNAAFQTTAQIPQTSHNGNRFGRGWSMSHQDIYDAEVRCFWDYLPSGSQSFEFLFRAQRAGSYETPAVLAECMYEPEIFGRSRGCVWKIEE